MIGLLAEGAALRQLRLAAGGARQHGAAASAADLGRGVAVDLRDVEARGAAHVHEEGVGALDEAAALVGSALRAERRVAEVGVEKAHVDCKSVQNNARERPFWLRSTVTLE